MPCARQVTGTFSASSNYAYVYGGATQTKVDGISIYTYPVVFANGEVGTLSTATPGAATPKNVYEFTTDAKGLATFTSPANLINNAMIKVLANGSALFTNKDTGLPTSPISTAGVAAGAAFWNVSDIAKSGVFADMPVKDQQVAVVLDADGNIKVVFIIDDMIGELTANVSTLTISNLTGFGSISTANVLGGSGAITGAADNDTFKVTYTATTAQTVTIKVNGTTLVDGATGTGNADESANAFTLTTAIITDGSVTVTVTITEANKDTRTTTYSIAVS